MCLFNLRPQFLTQTQDPLVDRYQGILRPILYGLFPSGLNGVYQASILSYLALNVAFFSSWPLFYHSFHLHMAGFHLGFHLCLASPNFSSYLLPARLYHGLHPPMEGIYDIVHIALCLFGIYYDPHATFGDADSPLTCSKLPLMNCHNRSILRIQQFKPIPLLTPAVNVLVTRHGVWIDNWIL